MATMNSPAIQARGLEQSYRSGLLWRARTVLADIHIELARGGRLGLVGPNGSGKSTLLRLIAGVERPSRGELILFGGAYKGGELRRRIGFLPEDASFPRELRAQETMELLASLRGVPRSAARERSRELLSAVGLERAAATTLGRFSRGMLRRFGLAQAMVHEPELILLDEPTAGLDAQGFAVFDELLARARARGASLVIASHVLTDLQTHCDRLIVLHEGGAAASGAPADLLGSEQGTTMLEVEGLDSAGLEAVRETVEARGGHLLMRGPSTAALRALYRRLSQ